MISVLIIDKTGSIKTQNIKTFEKEEFYKKCGFRKSDNFEQRNVWKKIKIGNDIVDIMLFAKDVGIARTENKYDLPPPVDTPLYFGSILIAGEDSETKEPYSLTVEIWEKLYEKLFGGFEDINKTDDEYEEDELDNVPDEMKTKNGYLKDGFVVEDKNLTPPETSEDEIETEESDISDDEENFDSELEYEEYEYECQD